MLNFSKKDAYGQVLKPGYVCARPTKNKGVEFCVYKGEVNGSKSKGTFGKFLTDSGTTSLKYTSVVFAYDPITGATSQAEGVGRLIRRFYEDVR